jgi:hypothetical protein
MRNPLPTLFFLFSFTFLNAQLYHEGQCGMMPDEALIERLLANKEAVRLNNHDRNDTTIYIPIQLHLVAKDDGLGRMREKNALEGICKLNQDFAPLNIVFYLKEEFNYIDMTAMFDLQFPNVPPSVNGAYLSNKVPNAINIYVGNGLSSGNSGYYTGSFDIIYMDKSFMTGSAGILAHEMGHFFSLPHTFLGWESTEYDPTQPTPLTVSWGNFTNDVEFVDRDKNCETSGDFFCGTPADYITSGASNCNYTGGAVDPDSVLIDPDERNHMAYYSFSGCPEYHFSDDQQEVILQDYESRWDLSNLDCPELKEVTETANLLSPINHELIPTYDNVDFTWNAVPNADFYLIEISPLASFGFVWDYKVVKDTTFTSTELNANRDNYYWRIWAFSQTDFCEIIFSDSGHFATGDQVNRVQEVEFLKEVVIAPNPTLEGNTMLRFNADKNESVNISVSNIQGKIVQWIDNQLISVGENTVLLSTENLPNGLYFVNIQSNGRVISKRLVKL